MERRLTAGRRSYRVTFNTWREDRSQESIACSFFVVPDDTPSFMLLFRLPRSSLEVFHAEKKRILDFCFRRIQLAIEASQELAKRSTFQISREEFAGEFPLEGATIRDITARS